MAICSYDLFKHTIMIICLYTKFCLDYINFALAISLATYTSGSPFEDHIIGNISKILLFRSKY